MKNLIVTADDYGVFPSINEGIKQAIRAKKVNSVACFSNYKDSITNIKELTDEFGNKVDIGCHLSISSGEPLYVKNNTAFTNGNYFKDYSDLNITGILKQEAELKKELQAQIQILLDNQIPVKHLSCHHNTLTNVKGLLKVYLEVAAQFNLPMRSVNIQPSKKDATYRLVLDLLLLGNVPTKVLREIRSFRKEINEFVATYKVVKTPEILESSHYGPIPLVDVWENGIERRKREKHKAITDFLTNFIASEHKHAELMLHLIDYAEYLNGIDDDILYPGVNKKYFDSRQIELKSILEYDFSNEPQLEYKGWSNL